MAHLGRSLDTKIKQLGLALAVILALAAGPAFAHHSFAAEFDAKKPVTLKGVFTRMEWTNPHAHFYINVTDAGGGTTLWEFELASPNGLMRHGWSRNSLKPGDVITVIGYLAKDGSKLANARSVTMADGRTIFAGSPGDEGPPQ